MRFFLLATALALAACGADDESAFPNGSRLESSSSSSGGGSSLAPGQSDGGSSSSGGAGDAGSTLLPTSCEGDCRESSLTLHKGGTEVRFDRVQFGFDRSTSYPQLKLSAFHGGADACPTQGDEPSHAVQIVGVPAPFDGNVFGAASGITATLYDFAGDVVSGGSGVLKGTRIVLTPVAANLDAQPEDVFVAFDVHLEFEQAISVDGHVFATHCASIDQR